MILVDSQIKELVESDQRFIKDFSEDFLQPATYDLRIGPSIYLPGENPEKAISISQNGGFHKLAPYENVVLTTYETLRIPEKIVGRFGLKSGYTRRGLIASAGPQVDPGFRGKLFVTVYNFSAVPYLLRFKKPFLSIEFQGLDRAPEKPYDGPYQDKEEITSDIVEDLLCFEGLNLSQMQTQFTELLEHVKAWSQFATRIDEFLTAINAQTESVNILLKNLALKELSPANTKEKFERLTKRWKSETEVLSTIQEKAMHPAYQQIIGMGKEAIPLILNQMAREPDHWFWALKSITNEDPVPEEAKGDVIQMTKFWLEWGQSNGLS